VKSLGFIRTFAVCMLALILLGSLGFAQVTKGSISGTIVDPTGAVVGDATLKATDSATGAVITTTSDKAGYFRFSLVPTGEYTVEVTKQGFSKSVRKGVTVVIGGDTGLGSLTLAVGANSTTIEVSASGELLETTQAQISSTFDEKSLTATAGLGDNEGVDALALFIPGVASTRDNNFSNENGAGFAVNGVRGRNNDQQIDGQNNNDNSVGGPALYVADAEFVGEYQVVTSNFGPEYGRNGGSVVNVQTKSGTNALHGSIYGTENNSILNTIDQIDKRFNGVKKLPRYNDEFGGFTLGGPVVKNRVFFFEGFDQEIYSGQNLVGSGSLTPTPTGVQEMLAAFPTSDSVKALANYGPYSISAGNPTPVNPQNYSVGGNTVEMGGINRTLPDNVHIFNWLNRVDVSGAKDNVNVRYLLSRRNFFNVEGSVPTGYIGNQPSLAQQFKLGWTRTLSPHMTNEASVSFGRNNAGFGGGAVGTLPTVANLFNAVSSVSTGSGNLGFGPTNTLPQSRVVNTWQLQDNWNYLMGKHQFKAGINWTYQRSLNVFLPNANGTFSFSNWSAYAANTPLSVSLTEGNANLDFREYDTFAYVGDDWKVASNFTVNLGLTYSFYGQPANLFHTNDLKLSLWNSALGNGVDTFHTLPSQKSLFAPSIGFAWTPKNGPALLADGKTVIRGGYRLAYDPPFYNIYLNIASAAPQVMAQTFTWATGMPGLSAVPTGPNARASYASLMPVGSDPRAYSQTTVSPNFGADNVQNWSLGFERQISPKAVLEVRYVGTHGGDLFQSINGNPRIDGLESLFPGMVPTGVTPCTTSGSYGIGRVDCSSARIRVRQNSGYSDYNGLQAQFRTSRLYDQLSMTTSFTWSKTTDNVSEIFGSGGAGTSTAFAQNPFNYKSAEHGTSGLDVPKNWTVNFQEELPIFKAQKGVLGHIAGGWVVSGTYIMASGQPYSPEQYYQNYLEKAYSGTPDPNDYSFNASYAGFYDNSRPFVGNNKANVKQIGIYAGDVCLQNGISLANCASSIGYAPNQLLDFNQWNTTPNLVPISKDKVRYIVNAYEAQQIAGTPWGDAGRNSLRDYWTNTGNASIIKNIKLKEHMSAQFRATFLNVFNHPNYSSVDTWIDDAGYATEGNGFGDPSLTTGGTRKIIFGAKIAW